MQNIIYKTIYEFEKDFKKLSKKFSSLEDDLKVAKRDAIELYHIHNVNNQSIFPIPHFCNAELLICKLKKFSCKSLKGRGCKSGIRIIYAYYIGSKTVEFIEIYFKGSKKNENSDRIKKILKFATEKR